MRRCRIVHSPFSGLQDHTRRIRKQRRPESTLSIRPSSGIPATAPITAFRASGSLVDGSPAVIPMSWSCSDHHRRGLETEAAVGLFPNPSRQRQKFVDARRVPVRTPAGSKWWITSSASTARLPATSSLVKVSQPRSPGATFGWATSVPSSHLHGSIDLLALVVKGTTCRSPGGTPWSRSHFLVVPTGKPRCNA
jgi:hypothetical protein